MTSSQWGNDESSTERPSFRFSLAGLFALTLAVAGGLALMLTVPDVLAIPAILCLAVVVPAVLATAVCHGRGYWRTFCVGALFPTGLFLYAVGWLFGYVLVEDGGGLNAWSGWIELFENIDAPIRPYAGATWLLAILTGLSCVVTRRLVAGGR